MHASATWRFTRRVSRVVITGRGRSVDHAAKGRAQEVIKGGDAKYQDIRAEAQSEVQAARDQVGQGVERGKQRFEEAKDQAAHRTSGDLGE
jgi:ElaB/YqjD/DUF883 family membrane-anchored ribosome-binding protein